MREFSWELNVDDKRGDYLHDRAGYLLYDYPRVQDVMRLPWVDYVPREPEFVYGGRVICRPEAVERAARARLL